MSLRDIPAQGTPYGRLFKGDICPTVGANTVRPLLCFQVSLFKGARQLLCPVGHLLYERRLFASPRLDGGVSDIPGERCSPLR